LAGFSYLKDEIVFPVSSSEASLSIVIDARHVKKLETALKAEFQNGLCIHQTEEISVLNLTRSDIPEVSAHIYDVLVRAGVNIMMISQPPGGHNVSFIVPTKDADRVVRDLHREIGLNDCGIDCCLCRGRCWSTRSDT
jgi:aspartokinase